MAKLTKISKTVQTTVIHFTPDQVVDALYLLAGEKREAGDEYEFNVDGDCTVHGGKLTLTRAREEESTESRQTKTEDVTMIYFSRSQIVEALFLSIGEERTRRDTYSFENFGGRLHEAALILERVGNVREYSDDPGGTVPAERKGGK